MAGALNPLLDADDFGCEIHGYSYAHTHSALSSLSLAAARRHTLSMLGVGSRIKRLRRKLGENQAAFGKRFGVDQSTVSKWEGDKQNPEPVQLDIVASLESDLDHPQEGNVNSNPLFTIIPVTGRVGAGAVVYPIDSDTTSHTQGHTKAPKGFGAVEAVVVEGDSMYPAYRAGDTIYIDNRPAELPLLPDKEYVLRLSDGRQVIKMVEPAAGGRYNLLAHNAPVERDVTILDAYRVRYVRRA